MPGRGKLTRLAGGIGLATLASRILGLVRTVLIAKYFGVGVFADAFFIAFQIPNVMRRLFGEGGLQAAFIPVFTECMEKDGSSSAWGMASAVTNVLMASLFIISGLGVLLAPIVTRLLVPGFDAESAAITTDLLRIMFPYIFFIGLATLGMGILNSLRHFAIPAITPIILNLFMIAALFFFIAPESRTGIIILSVSVILGGVGQLLIQLPILRAKGMQFRLIFNHPKIKKLFFLAVPATLGLAIYQINIVVDRICASFAFIVGEGAISALTYGVWIVQVPIAIFSTAIATATFPRLAGYAAKGEIAKLRQMFSFSFRTALTLLIPASAGLIVLRKPIISLLFERGAFDATATEITATALLFYSIGLFAYGAVHILSKTFYSLQDMKTPLRAAIVAMVSNVALNIILMFPLGLGGLALATSISAVINMFILVFLLNRRIGGVDGKKILNSLFKIIPITAIMMFLCHILMGMFANEVLAVLIPIAAGAAFFIGVSLLLKLEEVGVMVRRNK
ncbi:murein biosynthesis integral membrane protein MurJ [candidate division NPL-UPA2 bacterium Unc8]|uniref:Probable lipid II flippase MurJ n=1 Tax=candidate division NPL-UPA2 bacterium Unc8 TaxID=1980939 RepID=A0A399FUE0_UNCN2|nr:MAG: murein biosynthesis integral membrane protein MurJ [candidate division NPL-UPA2 bacterium Unc8]